MFPLQKNLKNKGGFTLVELLIVIGIFTILTGVATVNLLRPQIKSSVDATVKTIIADARNQQIKSMIGSKKNSGDTGNHGIYFSTTEYVLFTGTSYNAADTTNITIPLSPGSEISVISLPTSQIIFSRLNGEISNYNGTNNSIIIRHEGGASETTISFNELGVTNVN